MAGQGTQGQLAAGIQNRLSSTAGGSFSSLLPSLSVVNFLFFSLFLPLFLSTTLLDWLVLLRFGGLPEPKLPNQAQRSPAGPGIHLPNATRTLPSGISGASAPARLTSWDRVLIFLLLSIFLRQIRVGLAEARLRRLAKGRAAKLAPQVQSQLPLGLSLVMDKVQSLKSGQPNDLLKLFITKTQTKRDALQHQQEPKPQRQPTGNRLMHHHTTANVVRSRSFGSQTIYTLDHRDAQYILSTGFKNFGKSPAFQSGFRRLLGQGVFLSDQRSLWSWHRQLTRPHFSKERISDLVAIEDHSQRIADWLHNQSQSKPSEYIDIQDVFSRFTLTVGTQHLFGRCIDSLSDLLNDRPLNPDEQHIDRLSRFDSGAFDRNFSDAQHWAIVHALIPRYLRWCGQWLHPKDQATEAVLKVIDQMVQESKASQPKDVSEGQEPPVENLLDHLLRSGCSDDLVVHECLNILLAARDTTSSLLTCTIFELGRAKKPVWENIRQEITDILGDHDQQGSSAKLTLQNVREMKYLRAVLNETLRLHPPVWANSRHAFEDDVLPSGTFVPAGTDCRYLIREIQRNPELWGQDAEEFDPDRWIDDRKKIQARDPFIFQPFSAGPRICLGQQFAYTEASVALIKIIERFKGVELLDEKNAEEIPGVILSFRGGMKVRFLSDT